MRRKLLYGWIDRDKFRISAYPADAPVRPSVAFDSYDEVREFLERKRADILWWPPLPHHVLERKSDYA